MIHTLLRDCRLWKEFKLESSPLNEINNDSYFYTVVVLAVVLLTINLINTTTIAGAVVSFFGFCYTIILDRYIYLYRKHIDNNIKVKEDK